MIFSTYYLILQIKNLLQNLYKLQSLIDNLHLLVVHMGRKKCGPDWNYRNVCSPFMRIYYILSGEAEIITERRVMPLRGGNLYMIPAFTPHTCRCDNAFEHYYIHLYNEASPYILEDWEFPEEIPAVASDLAVIERLGRLCPGMELSQTDPKTYDNNTSLAGRIELNKRREIAVKIESRGLIYLLLARFLSKATLKPYCRDERIRTAVRHIQTNLSSRPDIDTLAEMTHLSKDHFIRLFKKETGVTPLNYITGRLIEAAQLKLATEALPVKAIAFSLGYEDQAYFNRMFKKATGITPLQYRDSVAKIES